MLRAGTVADPDNAARSSGARVPSRRSTTLETGGYAYAKRTGGTVDPEVASGWDKARIEACQQALGVATG